MLDLILKVKVGQKTAATVWEPKYLKLMHVVVSSFLKTFLEYLNRACGEGGSAPLPPPPPPPPPPHTHTL